MFGIFACFPEMQAQWVPVQGMDGATVYDIEIQDSVVFIVGPGQGISRRNIQAGGWNKTFPHAFSNLVHASEYVLCHDYYDRLFRSNNRGLSWDTVDISPYWGDNLVAMDSILFMAASNYLIRSDDYGANWTPVIIPPFLSYCMLECNGPALFIHNMYSPPAYVSTDLGVSWDSLVSIGLPGQLEPRSLYYYQSTYWLAQLDGGVYKFSESAGYWVSTNDTLKLYGFDEFLGVLYGFGPQGVFQLNSNFNGWITRNEGLESTSISGLAAYDTLFFCATDIGPFRTSTTLIWEPYYDGLHGLSILDVAQLGNEIWVCSSKGLHKSTDGGLSFTMCPISWDSPPQQVALTDSAYYLSTYYSFYISYDQGLTWLERNEGLVSVDNVADFALGDEYLYLLKYNTLFRSVYTPILWVPTTCPQSVYLANIAAHDSTLLVTRNSSSQLQYPVQISHDNGETFDTLWLIERDYWLEMTYTNNKFFLYSYPPYYFSADGGYTWDSITINNIHGACDLDENDECIAVVGYSPFDCSYSPLAYLSYDHGGSWLDVIDNLDHCGSNAVQTITLMPTRILLGTTSNGLWYRDDLLTGEEERLANKVFLLSIYPNPTVDRVNVEFTLNETSMGEITIYDLMGRPVYSSGRRLFTRGENRTAVDTRQLKPGVYILAARMNDSLYSSKIVVY